MTHAETPLEISCEAVRDQLAAGADFLFLDCREATEHAAAAISGARLIPMGEIGDRLPELDEWKTRPVVVHCHHGGRSLRVAMFLRRNGFGQAASMAGGIDRWSQAIDANVPRY